MKKSRYIVPLIIIFFCASTVFSEEPYSIFKTDYVSIHYVNREDLDTFLSKVGNVSLAGGSEVVIIKARIDRLVERVESILDMYPEGFKVDIILTSGYSGGNIAFYSNNTRKITIFVERVTDGVFAHELAHAVMHAYFKTSPSRNVQEILCRYVDAYLWKDY